MVRRFAHPVLIALVASCALFAVASAPAQAQTSSTRCSPWKTNVYGFQYRECIVTQPSGSGTFIRTGLQVMNRTSEPRPARMVQRTIIGGRVQSTVTCPTKASGSLFQELLPNRPATCWSPSSTGYALIGFNSYGYGNGTLTDKDSGQSAETSSPVHDNR